MPTLEAEINRIVEFDMAKLPREKEFGENAFQDAVEPAKKIQRLFQSLPLSVISELPDDTKRSLTNLVGLILTEWDQIVNFDKSSYNANERNRLIRTVHDRYEAAFNMLHPLVSYGFFHSIDRNLQESQMAEAIEGFDKKIDLISYELKEKKIQVDQIMAEIRAAAAEQGVSQQATYFRDEAQHHVDSAQRWKWATFAMALVLIVAAIGSLFLHKVPLLDPKTDIQSYQLIASKILLFVVLTYMLLLCAKNFMSHKHNAVVNRHRQNALMTFMAISNAASDSKMKDVILTHASSCIFAPQETGYSKGAGIGQLVGSKSVIELIRETEKGE